MKNLHKAVDTFHFLGRKDANCQKVYNPYTLKKKLGIGCLNTPVCEPSFNWLNKFGSTKDMNESHFEFFFLYIVD